MATQPNTQIKKMSLREIIKRGAVATFSTLRQNSNGYPYVTMLTKDGKSNNVYFGKKSAAKITEDYDMGANVVKALSTADIVESTNEAGEVRHKISLSGESDYTSNAELMAAFGLDEAEGDFNLKAFQDAFQAREDAAAPARKQEEAKL